MIPSLSVTADKIIFPGVGEASSAMNYLQERKTGQADSEFATAGAWDLSGYAIAYVCIPKKMIHNAWVFSAKVLKNLIRLENIPLKVPQMGWNNIYDLKSVLFKGVPENSYCYFVHGYYAGLGETYHCKNGLCTTLQFGIALEQFLWRPISSGKKRRSRGTNFEKFYSTLVFNMSIEIIPAIDILHGKCVRLNTG